jgi:hypothetical protein
MKNKKNDRMFVPIRTSAARIGVPLAWLKKEVESGRIPAIRAGRQWLIHLERAREIIAKQAKNNEGGGK